MRPFDNFCLLRRRFLLVSASASLSLAAQPASASARPRLMLANSLPDNIDLAAYWVSEKYDGIRGYWDGQRLLTRGGDIPVERDWRTMRYMVFDLPQHDQVFDRRLPAVIAMVEQIRQTWVVAVRHQRVSSRAALQDLLKQVERRGGEGLMLHRGDSHYRAGRSDDLFKFKSMDDAEATVIAHLPGKGKYTGLVGALTVRNGDGIRFNLGSGLSDAMRRKPPPVGSVVTYRYRGFHPSGKPRFAVLLRVQVN